MGHEDLFLAIHQSLSCCYRMVSHKASQALRPFSYLLCVLHLSSNHSWFIHQMSLAVTSRDTL